jgi:hypothetical protein
MKICKVLFFTGVVFILNIVSAQAQVPTSNLELHLKPDAGVTLENGKLSVWKDQSGNGNQAEQATSTNRPTIERGVLNGYDAFYFDGVNDYINLPIPADLNIQNSSYEIFIVMQSKLTHTGVEFLLAGGIENYELHTNGSGGMRYIPRNGQYIDVGSAGDYTDQNTHLINLRASGSNAELVMDQVTSQSSGTSGISSDNTQLRIGSRASGILYYDGYIAEVIIYSDTLSVTDRTSVEDYLDAKYFTTNTAEPTANASSVSFDNITQSEVTVRIDQGDGQRRLVLMKEGSEVDGLPSDNSSYSSDPTFGSGAQIGTGNYVVYNGSDSVVTVDGLTSGTTYHVSVVEMNGEPGSENYRTSDPQIDSVTTATEPPALVDVSLSSLTATSVTVNTVLNPNNNDVEVFLSRGSDPSSFSDSTFVTTVSAGTSDVPVNTDITGVDLTNTYYYRVTLVYDNWSERVFSRIYAVRYKDQITGSQLALWMSADAVPEASTDGDAVPQWEDISGNNFKISQDVSSSQPKWYDNVVNGEPVVRFDGGDELLTPKMSDLGLQNSDYEIFIVSKTSSSGVQFLYSATEGTMEAHLNGGQGLRFIPESSYFLDSGSDLAYSDGNAHIIHNRVTATDAIARADSTTGVGVNDDYRAGIDQAIHIGRRATGVYGLNGDIAEILIFKSALTSDQYNAVADYLQAKYGVTAYNRVTPDSPSTAFSTSNVSGTEATVSFTPGNGERRLIAVKEGGAVDTDPANFITYTANAEFGSGSQLGTGNYVVYDGTGNEVTITGLNLNTTYHIEVFEYNSTVSSQYQTGSTLTGTFTTANYLEPVAELTKVSNLTATTADVGISVNPQGDETSYCILYGTDQSFADTTSATVAGSTFSTITADVTLSGLTGNTLYYTKLMAFNTQGDTSYSKIGTFRYQEDIPSDSLSFWIDAGNGVDVNGTDVTEWYDLSGAFHKATPGSVDPQLQSSVINGQPAVSFTPFGASMNLPETGEMNLSNSEYEFFTVLKSDNTGYVFSGKETGSFSLDMNGTLEHRADQVQLSESDTSLFRNNHTFLANGYADNAGAQMNVNYITSDTQTGDYRYMRSSERIRIGQKDTLDGFDGQLAEMIIYHRKLTDQERKEVHTYLSDKYGLNLGINAPTQQITNLTAADVKTETMTFTFSPGDGSRRLLIMKEGATVDASPSDSVSYQANATFGAGTELATGNFVVAVSRDNSVTITGLSPGTTYTVKAFEFSGLDGEEQYLLANAPEITATAAVNTTLTDIQPARNSNSILVDSDISLTFDQTLQTSSVNDSTSIKVTSNRRGHLPGSFVFSNSNQTVTYTPDEAFSPGEHLSVLVIGDSLSFANPAEITNQNITYQVRTHRSLGRFDSSRVQDDKTGIEKPLYLTVFDSNHDGWNDLIGEINYKVGEFQNDQDSTYSYAQLVDASDADKVKVGDLNNDGYLDIVFNLATEAHLKVYLGQANGTYTFSETIITGEGSSDYGTFDLRDMNNDGWLDIVVLLQTSQKTITIWQNQKDGTFVEELNYGMSSYYFDQFAIADYNNDGILDFAMIKYTNGALYLVTGTENGSYTNQSTGLSVGGFSSYKTITAVDLNNDNYVDIVALDYQSDEIVYFSNQGDNSFAESGRFGTSNNPDMMEVGDVNGDGYQDVVVMLHNIGSNEYNIAVYEGKGDGTLTLGSVYPTGQYGDTFTMADMNADGAVDLLVTSEAIGSYGIHTIYNVLNEASEVTLTGSEGWRLMASPFVDVSYATMFDDLWTQGIPGSDSNNGTANVYTWGTETATSDAANWAPVSSMSDSLTSGSGSLIYVYSDDNSDGAGDAGFPKTLSVKGIPNDSTRDLSGMLNTNSNGWTLLGNPFMEDIDWDKISRSNLSNSVYVYDPNTASWKTWNGTTGSLTDGQISRMNGFFVQTMASGPTIEIADTAKIGDNDVFRGKRKTPSDPPKIVSLRLSNEQGMSDEAWLQFSEDGRDGQDPKDALQLAPLNANYTVLSSKLNDSLSADINHLPVPGEELRIPLQIQSSSSGTHQLALGSADLPEGWEVRLYDHATETMIDLDEPYSFEYQAMKQKSAQLKPSSLMYPVLKAKSGSGDRFSLVISPGTVTANEDPRELPTKVALKQNYPNPFNPTTIIKYQLPQRGAVSLRVYNILGREVATLVNERKAAGYYQVNFDAGRLSSGMYIYRLTAGNKVITKKFTLIK